MASARNKKSKKQHFAPTSAPARPLARPNPNPNPTALVQDVELRLLVPVSNQTDQADPSYANFLHFLQPFLAPSCVVSCTAHRRLSRSTDPHHPHQWSKAPFYPLPNIPPRQPSFIQPRSYPQRGPGASSGPRPPRPLPSSACRRRHRPSLSLDKVATPPRRPPRTRTPSMSPPCRAT